MDIHDLFQSPGSRIAAFAEMQLHLYRHDVRLQDYFEPLQLDTLTTARAKSGDRRAFNRPFTWAVQGADKVSRLRSRQKIKTDVLFCPNQDLRRETERRFFVRTLLGLAQTGAKILCLLPADFSSRGELDAQLAATGRSSQVEFFDPASSLNTMDERLHSMAARIRGHADFEETVRVLEPRGLNPGQEVRAGFERIAFYVEAWERLEPWVEFDAVVARCHWLPLCSPVCRTARQRGKPVITFQQGVIGHTLDVPVTASKYVAFGQPSASFLARMNSRFFQAAELLQPEVEYVEGGCLVDKVIPLPDQFAHQTVLLVDVPPAPGDFYGIESQGHALMELAERLLTAELPLRRVVIRPHPYWSNLDLESCKRLVRAHPDRCELSHPSWSLEDDLRRSSIVAGILSGVLTVAAACGLPAIFLETEHGYTTGDLACFSPRQTLLPDAAFCEIGKILSDRQAYAEAQSEALKNAREYYANSTNVELDGTFFERLLHDTPVSPLPRA